MRVPCTEGQQEQPVVVALRPALDHHFHDGSPVPEKVCLCASGRQVGWALHTVANSKTGSTSLLSTNSRHYSTLRVMSQVHYECCFRNDAGAIPQAFLEAIHNYRQFFVRFGAEFDIDHDINTRRGYLEGIKFPVDLILRNAPELARLMVPFCQPLAG